MGETFFSKIRTRIDDLSLDIVLPIFLLSLVLELAHFFPTLGEINIWDEATYIQNGFMLLTKGLWTDLAGSPLSSMLYALTTLPVVDSPNFFALSDAFARIVLFSLIFFSAYLIARELRPFANPWIMLAMIFIVPVATTMFLFPSDALFTGLAGLAFWQMLSFYNHRQRKHLWWASVFMGLGMLARAEGLILMFVLVIVTLVMILPNKKWYRDVISVTLPFLLLVGGYVLAFGVVMGDFSTGLPERTFNNFESGHEVIYSQTGVFTATISARLESREAFGTPEENDYSVFRAITRNPRVYKIRLRNAIPVFEHFAVKAYGNKFILIFIWLGMRGLIELINKKHWPLVVMCLLWFSPLAVGFLNTFFREGYFMMPYFVVFFLSSIGLSAMIRNFDDKTEQVGMVVASLLVLAIGIISRNSSMVFRNALFVFGLVFIAILRNRIKDVKQWRQKALWLLLVLAFIIRGGYLSPTLPNYGESGLEKSVYFLQETLPAESNVLAGAPANIWAARMTYYGINSYDIPDFVDEEEFMGWIRKEGIDAVYVDSHFPEVFRTLIRDLSGEDLREVYKTSGEDIVIYLVDKDDT